MRRSNRSDERGQSLVEFALIAPVFFLLFFAILEGALMFQAWVSVQHAAGLGARYAVTGRESCTSGGAGRLGCITSEAQRGIDHLRDGASATVSVRSWAYPAYTSVSNGSAGKQCDAVEVAVSYTYRPVTLVSAIVGNVTLTGRQRFVNEPFGLCTAAAFSPPEVLPV